MNFWTSLFSSQHPEATSSPPTWIWASGKMSAISVISFSTADRVAFFVTSRGATRSGLHSVRRSG